MYYCYSIKQGLFDNEMAYAKELGVYIFYDEEKDSFFDKDNNLIDIKGLKIFPRTGALQAVKLIDAVVRHGGDSIVTKDDYDKTIDWPRYYNTRRCNMIISGQEILDNPQKILDLFGEENIFFKTKYKNYSNVIDIAKLFDKTDNFYKALAEHRDDEFIISDVVDIARDKCGSLEYRAFVVEGEIYNVSRMHDRLLNTIPDKVMIKLHDVVEKMSGIEFPRSYVVDLFAYNSIGDEQEIDVLEFNPILASGTFLYNTVFTKIDDLTHSDPILALPVETHKYISLDECGYDLVSDNEPSICYNISGGFASDIMSFALFGKKASPGTYVHIYRTSGESLEDISLIEEDNEKLLEDELSDEKIFGHSISKDTSVDEIIKLLNKKMSESINTENS